jgi:trehalose 6-phosphate phosphatase
LPRVAAEPSGAFSQSQAGGYSVQLKDNFDRLAAAHHAGRHLALLFDYDGALAPSVTRPSRCPISTAQLLSHFADLPRVGVGVLCNRALTEWKSLVRLPKLSYVGTRGLQIDTKGLAIVHPRAQRYRPYLEHAISTVRAAIDPFDGAWLEDKTLTITVHHRAVSREESVLLRQCLYKALERYKGLLTAVNGPTATEILPDIGWAKSDTVRQIVESQSTLAIPFYAGSDASDEQAFQFATEVGGLTIGIGPFAPQNAMHYLPDPERLTSELTAFLSSLLCCTSADANFRPFPVRATAF